MTDDSKPRTRTERDSLGAVEVPADRYWGAATERALALYPATGPRPHSVFIRTLGLQKQAAAEANAALGVIAASVRDAVAVAAAEVAAGTLDSHFPLTIWQSGSGTQFNMNANEVIANRASEIAGGPLGAARTIHPNDHVNASQSSNDTIPTVMHVAALTLLRDALEPALDGLIDTLDGMAQEHGATVKVGRTHLMDAAPTTVGAEFAALALQLGGLKADFTLAADGLRELAQGGTAVGTGLNAPEDFARQVARALSGLSGLDLVTAPLPAVHMAGHGAMVRLSAALSALAGVLEKLASDVRLSASGPRAGLGEFTLPSVEPGSSIMAGKINPGLAEAMISACALVHGHHTAVTHAAAMAGQFQLNTAKPLIAHAVLDGLQALSDMMRHFTAHMLNGLTINRDRLAANVRDSLMTATVLVPRIGYDKTAALVKLADGEGLGLREAAARLDGVDPDMVDRLLTPAALIPGYAGGE
ncbi:class II fumarate hydratase [Eilatimonas milleporae]|uniref:fumarate hydratase n=1 Tax=Eilatimonas milleporae TaxID=911205 RepID=A0A3M0CWG8_9PROT|nr:class II fumarate hydratase [Eilatimonas milleporae]RMB08123.1 fumarase class II [Eilatimonas milleporae]